MTRRGFSRTLLAAAPSLWVKAAAPKKNVLFIAIDDLNDWVGPLGGYPGVQTPNLDRLAGQGVVFQSAHCAAPLCNPSRAALMLGRRPASTGVYDNNQPYAGAKAVANAVTLNQTLKDSGYLTLGSGKIYHGTWGAYADTAGWHDYGRPTGDFRLEGALPLAGAAGRGNFDFGPTATGDEAMNDYLVTDWVNGHLQRKRDQPLFLACGIYRPHLPWHVPKKYFDLYPLDKVTLPVVREDDLDDVPAIGKRFARAQNDHERITKADAWKKAVQAYLACISFADTMLGRVLRAWETGPYANDMDIVLWSDHGWHLGEKLHWRKFTLWERSTRNVLMMRSPGIAQRGGVCDRTVSMVDVYPTLMELTGVTKPSGLEGQSLVPWLRNPKAPKADAVVTTYGFKNHAVRSAGWRYIRYSDGGEELYDRTRDPNEWTNVAAQPEHAKTKAELARWLPAHDEPDAPKRIGTGGEN